MRGPGCFARRFIGGETVDEGLEAARAIERRGLAHTFNYLGEHIRTLEAANSATRAYRSTIETVRLAGLDCNLSVKLTQLGLELDSAACVENLRQILDVPTEDHCYVRVDMESSAFVDDTLRIFETLWAESFRNVSVVLQSALRRSRDDLARVNALGARVRLVKGAYREPTGVAYQGKSEVNLAFLELMAILLSEGTRPAFATYDPAMITATCAAAKVRGVPTDRLEFQMLYGVRRDLQAALQSQGHIVRVDLPFGADWFPYFMRRLTERPANVLFVVRSLLYEQLCEQRSFGDGS